MRAGDRLTVGHGAVIVRARPHDPTKPESASYQRWLRARAKGLTATEVPAVLGLSDYSSAFDVWARKTGRIGDADLSDQYPVARGTHMEPFLLSWWAADENCALLPTPELIAHPVHRWLLASLDGLGVAYGEVVVLEAKTAGWRARSDWWDDDTLIPDGYAAQVLTQLWVTGLETAHVVADIAGDWQTLVIKRDREWEAAILPLLEEFQAQVKADEPPNGYDPIRDYPLFNRVWIPKPKTTREATPAEAGLLWEWAARRDMKDAVDQLRGYIRYAMRDVAVLTMNGIPAATNGRSGLRAGKALTQPQQEETTS